LLGDGIVTVPVKQGFGTFAARMIPPVRARQLIEEGAKEALKDLARVQPYDPGRPAEIKVEFKSPDRMSEYANRKSVEVLDARTIVARGDDWWTAWKGFFF
jgi:D-amino peptidase